MKQTKMGSESFFFLSTQRQRMVGNGQRWKERSEALHILQHHHSSENGEFHLKFIHCQTITGWKGIERAADRSLPLNRIFQLKMLFNEKCAHTRSAIVRTTLLFSSTPCVCAEQSRIFIFRTRYCAWLGGWKEEKCIVQYFYQTESHHLFLLLSLSLARHLLKIAICKPPALIAWLILIKPHHFRKIVAHSQSVCQWERPRQLWTRSIVEKNSAFQLVSTQFCCLLFAVVFHFN